MDVSLERLTKFVPPPERASFAGTAAAFREVEEGLGVALPTGYKQVIGLYGYGVWQGSWCIASPFAEDRAGRPRPWYIPRYDLAVGPEKCASMRSVKAEWPDVWPWPVYPEPGGLLPWGMTDNAGTLFWLTEGAADSWPVLYEPDGAGPNEWERYDMPFTAFLLRTVERRGGFRVFEGEQYVGRPPRRFMPWLGWPSR